jgi:hypothetical protein
MVFGKHFVALRGIEWVKLVFPDVNMRVHVNVNVPEKEWSHALKAKFRKHGTNPCKQKLSGAIFIRGEVPRALNKSKRAPHSMTFPRAIEK